MSDFRSSFWRRAAGLVEPLSERALQAAVERGEVSVLRAAERRGEPTDMRGEGPLVWLHARGLERGLEMASIMARLWEERGDVDLLLTTSGHVDEGAMVRRLPAGVLHQYLPFDRPQAVQRFLSHWRPDLCLWSDGPEPVVLLSEVEKRDIPICLYPGEEQDAWMARRLRGRLRRLSRVFARSTTALAQLRSAGVSAGAAVLSGQPREDAIAPEVPEAERTRIAQALEARPVWLAAGVPREELLDVLQAHRHARRLNPRLVLIVQPEQNGDAAAFEKVIARSGFAWDRHDRLDAGGVPPDVVLADRSAPDALWYHLATVSFLGGSLARHGGQSPLAAAALGSAVLHGPHVGYFSDLYQRLQSVGAAVEVADAAALGRAVARVVVPDVAATMAHAGWRVCSDGAGATDIIVDALVTLLDDVEARP